MSNNKNDTGGGTLFGDLANTDDDMSDMASDESGSDNGETASDIDGDNLLDDLAKKADDDTSDVASEKSGKDQKATPSDSDDANLLDDSTVNDDKSGKGQKALASDSSVDDSTPVKGGKQVSFKEFIETPRKNESLLRKSLSGIGNMLGFGRGAAPVEAGSSPESTLSTGSERSNIGNLGDPFMDDGGQEIGRQYRLLDSVDKPGMF